METLMNIAVPYIILTPNLNLLQPQNISCPLLTTLLTTYPSKKIFSILLVVSLTAVYFAVSFHFYVRVTLYKFLLYIRLTMKNLIGREHSINSQ